jgi:hypothetical protein
MVESTDATPDPRVSLRRARGRISTLAMMAILLVSAGLITRQLMGQIDVVREQVRSLTPPRLLLPLLTTLLALLVDTVCWHRSVAACTGGRTPLRFRESFAILNASNLGKYLPGKVWAYGLQAHILRARGIPVSATLHANLTFSVAAVTAVGWLVAFGALWLPNRAAGISCAGALAVVLTILHLHYGRFVAWGVAFVRQRFGKDLPLEAVDARSYLGIVLFCFCNMVLFGVTAAIVLIELEGALSPAQFTAVTVVTAASWLIGFAAFFVPGGLGVRETAMTLMLDRIGVSGSVVLVPLVTRALVLAVEAVYGGVGILLLWRLDRSLHFSRRSGAIATSDSASAPTRSHPPDEV